MRRLYVFLIAMIVTTLAWSQASVQVIHNSPTPGTDSGPVVDIYINGALPAALTGVEFRQATPFLPLPSGEDVEVAVAVSPSTSVDDAIATFPLGQLTDGEAYTVIANGIVGDMATPFNLEVNAGAQTAAASGDEVALNVFHGSPGAPNVDVNTVFNGQLVSDLAYGDFTAGYLDVPAGAYVLNITAAGDPSIVASFTADLSSLGGGAATVVASGILGNTPDFTLLAVLADGTVIELPATEYSDVQIIHNSPTPGTDSGPAVDIYVNGVAFDATSDVAYRTATPFLQLPADVDIEVAVAPSPSMSVDDAIATFPLGQLAANENYTAVATGVVGDMTTPFTIAVNAGARTFSEMTDMVDFNVFHGSTDAPNVDIDARTVGNLISDLPYGEFSAGYFSVAPDVYYIDVRAAGDPNIVATFEADLSGLANAATTVFASGLLGDTPGFGLFAALPSGMVVELPATEVARIQIIHNSPSGTVDIYADGGELIPDFEYQTATEFLTAPAGVNIELAVAPGNSMSADDAVLTQTVSFVNGETYAVIAHGIIDDMDAPFELAVSAMAQERSTENDEAQIMVFHGTPDAPSVDIGEFASPALIEGLDYGTFTDGYLGLAPDGYPLEVRPAGGGFNDVVATFSADLSEFAGNAGIIMASGTLADGAPPFDLLLVTPDGGVEFLTPIALLNIIHNSPAEAASTVDIWVQSAFKVVEDLDYRTATGIGYFPTRFPLTIGIAPGDSESPADILFNVEDPLTLEDGRYNVAIANGIPGDAQTPFELAVSTDVQVFANDPANIDVTAFHGSQNAPAVDVFARDIGLQLIDSLAYGDFSATLPIPPATYYLEVYPEGTESLVATFESPIPAELAGLSVVGVASGLVGEEPPFDLIFFPPVGPSLTATPVAQVQVVHNAPNPTVDVYANDNILINDFVFRTATPFVDLPTRTDIEIDVAGEDSGSAADAIATFSGVRFNDGQKYVVMARGLVGDDNTPFGLDVFDMAQTSAAGDGTDLLLYHGSPDAPTVDVVVDGPGSVLFDDVSYGDFQGYVNVPASEYQLNITPGDDNSTIVKAYDADLSGLEGGAATVFASGLLGETMGETAFGVWVALADGTTFPLDEVVSADEVADKFSAFQVAPNPVRELAQVQFTTTETLNMVEEIRSLDGTLIRSSAIGTQPAGDHSREINASELSAGVYTYTLVTELGTIAKRFVVVK